MKFKSVWIWVTGGVTGSTGTKVGFRLGKFGLKIIPTILGDNDEIIVGIGAPRESHEFIQSESVRQIKGDGNLKVKIPGAGLLWWKDGNLIITSPELEIIRPISEELAKQLIVFINNEQGCLPWVFKEIPAFR